MTDGRTSVRSCRSIGPVDHKKWERALGSEEASNMELGRKGKLPVERRPRPRPRPRPQQQQQRQRQRQRQRLSQSDRRHGQTPPAPYTSTTSMKPATTASHHYRTIGRLPLRVSWQKKGVRRPRYDRQDTYAAYPRSASMVACSRIDLQLFARRPRSSGWTRMDSLD